MRFLTYGKILQGIGSDLIQLSTQRNISLDTDLKNIYVNLQKQLSKYEKSLNTLKTSQPPNFIIDEHKCLTEELQHVFNAFQHMLQSINYDKNYINREEFNTGISVLNKHEKVLLRIINQISNKLISDLTLQ